MRARQARVGYEPFGVVGVLAPWNYPVIVGLMPVLVAIAAGNQVMLTPSEFTPTINAVMEEILADQVAVVTGGA